MTIGALVFISGILSLILVIAWIEYEWKNKNYKIRIALGILCQVCFSVFLVSAVHLMCFFRIHAYRVYLCKLVELAQENNPDLPKRELLRFYQILADNEFDWYNVVSARYTRLMRARHSEYQNKVTTDHQKGEVANEAAVGKATSDSDLGK